jgi:hypothetical protein
VGARSSPRWGLDMSQAYEKLDYRTVIYRKTTIELFDGA